MITKWVSFNALAKLDLMCFVLHLGDHDILCPLTGFQIAGPWHDICPFTLFAGAFYETPWPNLDQNESSISPKGVSQEVPGRRWF